MLAPLKTHFTHCFDRQTKNKIPRKQNNKRLHSEAKPKQSKVGNGRQTAANTENTQLAAPHFFNSEPIHNSFTHTYWAVSSVI